MAEYPKDWIGAYAAIRAGFAGKSAKVTASRLLTQPNIAAALRAQNDRHLAAVDTSTTAILRDITVGANLDVAEIVNEHGAIVSVRLLPIHVRRAIQAVKTTSRTYPNGTIVVTTEVKLLNKARMHELLSRHAGFGGTQQLDGPPPPAFALPADTRGVSVH